MADIFISYSKKHAKLTEDLACDLEAKGYTTWWDTSLLPDDVFFPQTIRNEIEAAKAVIVIWAEHSVTSRWVYSEAKEADEHGKLFQVRDAALDPRKVPMPFTSGNITLVADRAKIFAALHRRQIVPSNKKRQEPERAPPTASAVNNREPRPHSTPYSAAMIDAAVEQVRLLRAKGRMEVDAVHVNNLHGLWYWPGGGKYESFKDLEAGPEMVFVPAWNFWMGSKDNEGNACEQPRHKVIIPRAFAVGRYPVTFDEWDAALAAGGVKHKPSDEGWGRGRRPVINVSWEDAQAYASWLSDQTGKLYRLLSEAEWEYCRRVRAETAYSFGNEITKAQAQFSERSWGSAGQTAEVGSFPANEFGLHDMHGNVWEWCHDCWNDTYEGAPCDGSACTAGDCARRVLRGGSWLGTPSILRSANRNWDEADSRNYCTGFRVARTLGL